MRQLRKLFLLFRDSCRDQHFLAGIDWLEGFVAKVLSLVMALVILVAIGDLIIVLFQLLLSPPLGFFNKTLFEIFGIFLNILIALEILENISVYLRQHVILVELVVVTSLVAIARKIIILDLKKVEGEEIIGLAIAILSLSISYWIIHRTNSKNPGNKH